MEQDRELLRGVLEHGVRIGLAGVMAGTVAALALARFLSAVVYGVSPRDPLVLAGVAALLLVVSVVASLVPTRRATLVDPADALRDA